MAVQRLVTELNGLRRQPAPQFDAEGRIYRAPAPKESTVLGFAGDVVVGAAQGVGDMVGGVFNLIFHPIQTIKGLVMLPITLITRPGDLVRAFTEPYSEAIASGHAGRAIGRGIVEIGSIIFGPKLIGKGIDAVKGATAAGKAGGAAGAASKVSELGAKAGKAANAAEKAGKVANAAEKAGKAANAAEKAGKVANAAEKAGKAAEVASTAAKVAEGVANGQKITVVVGTKVGKAAKAAKAARAADTARKAAKAAKAASAADTARKAANAAKAARRADAARRAAEAASAAKKVEEAARVASAAEKTAEAAKAARAAKAAAKAGKVTRTVKSTAAARAGSATKAAKFVSGHTGTKASRAAAQVFRETRRVRMWGSQKVVNLPGKGSMRITNFSYESVREVRYVNAAAEKGAKAAKAGSNVARAARKVPVKVPNLKVAKPFASASKKMAERAAALKTTGNLAEAKRLETLSAKLEAAGKVYAKGDKAKGLAMFRDALNKKGTQDALRLSSKADEVLAAFGKPGGKVFKRSQVVGQGASRNVIRDGAAATKVGKGAAKAGKAVRSSRGTARASHAKAGHATKVRAPRTPAASTPAAASAANGTGLTRAAARVDGWFKNIRAEFGKMGQMKVAQLPGHLWGLTTGLAKDLWAATSRVATAAWTHIKPIASKIGEWFSGLKDKRVGELFKSPFAGGTMK
jgi:hypothetical protein